MKVDINNQSKEQINEHEIKALVQFFAKTFEVYDREISIAIVEDDVMRRLNNDYRQKDTSTDILSFDGDDDLFGELIVDYKQVKRQDHYFSEKVDEELLFIITHGLVHLLGYEDELEEDRIVMINKGKEILKKLIEILSLLMIFQKTTYKIPDSLLAQVKKLLPLQGI